MPLHWVKQHNLVCCSASNRDLQQIFKESRRNRANLAFDWMEVTSKPLYLMLSFMNLLLFGHVYSLNLCSDVLHKLIMYFLRRSFLSLYTCCLITGKNMGVLSFPDMRNN